MTLYCDPTVRFGGIEVGGIRVSHLSHIDKPLNLALTVTRGKRAQTHVEPLAAPVTPAEPTPDQIAACTDLDALKAMFDAARTAETRALIRARKAELVDGPLILSAS